MADVKELQSKLEQTPKEDLHHISVNDALIRRYLRAFKKVDIAYENILSTSLWRKEFGIPRLEKSLPHIKNFLDQKKAMLLEERDLAGRPLLYIPAKNHSVLQRNLEELTDFVVYCLETSCNKCVEEKIDNLCIVFDLKGFRLSCMDYSLVRKMLWLLNCHYPERLGVCIIMNSPFLFYTCWSIIKTWMDDNTRSKFHFVSSEEELSSFIGPDILPTDA
ncbi:uncharacterized protein LOC143024788 isoform X1 [Oratosquilla oratoria]|uniref:uncharacterized protein LOC143024788 isoform X1 n=1 Tax=Oratosquilla oratoria TaxID=337810 RepID=UPI003F762CB7